MTKARLLQLDRSKPCHKYKMGNHSLGRRSAGKDIRVAVDPSPT